MSEHPLSWASLATWISAAVLALMGGVLISSAYTNAEELNGFAAIFHALGIVLIVAAVAPVLIKALRFEKS